MIEKNNKIIFFENKEDFYKWLEEHHNSAGELWVGYYKKHTDLKSLSWSESVDMALCFGWIDGIRKSIDEQSYKIRFTPRNVNSVWSAVNVKKVKVLIDLGIMRPEGLTLYNKRKDKEGYSTAQREIQLSEEYENRLKENASAWAFFNELAPSYKRNSIWWVMSAKRKETQLKRLNILISSSEEGLKIPNLRKK